ncbi:hypothetical protein UAY_00500 [Enterococcus moraviensis ATCC BAA-383]|uniref:WxL domain-containing protein n=1 Tax=Enterococcus moraviensis ATCC BAA-383 TaxID=1158609 RepID=R2RBM7_9ENTE|nr:hypothetical protein [Enterococcus moraviensis]EOI05026.1 hypothetical protein UAY_00500 [Enterococcus moraviensis ATCC BAA-383]EOT63809.1 hypothetical protein I586_03242 [Enterococcus moraviensis ATCC BAA-383]OJG67060.1 hypothetical protein RV09_GL002969 [Enterococcus moraviensis]
MKKLLFVSIVGCSLFLGNKTSYADENVENSMNSSDVVSSHEFIDSFGNTVKEVNEEDIIFYTEDSKIEEESSLEIAPRYALSTRKKNVKTYDEWSGYKRISDNVATGSKGGSITATKTATFGASVSGDIKGIKVNASGSVSSAKGYTLNIGANKRVYLGYRVRYAVETGTREVYRTASGKLHSSNKYTVKRPKYGEYALINY